MLGLFMIYPVFALYAPQYQWSTPTLIGLALGVYGLTQGLLQLPLATLSDRIGRRPVILGGLIIFALGSVFAGSTDNIYLLILGRALQGAGAIGSTLMAFAADLTSVENRTKAIAILGMTIGLSFGIALILGPIINSWFQLKGIFWFTAFCAIAGIAILQWVVPNPKKLISHQNKTGLIKTFTTLLSSKELLRLNISILILHAILTATFTVIPIWIKNLNISAEQQWHIYLPVLLGAFITIAPLLFFAEKKHHIKPVLLFSIVVLLIAQLQLSQGNLGYLAMIFALYIFFTGFTLLEALLPSLISKISPANHKGSAMGIYSSFQFFGIFIGGTLAGVIRSHANSNSVFLINALFCFTWFLLMIFMKKPPNFQTKILPLTEDINPEKARLLAKELLAVPGVVEAHVSIDDCIAYLKVDNKIFEDHIHLQQLHF